MLARFSVLAAGLCLLPALPGAPPGVPAQASPGSPGQAPAEMRQHDEPATFQAHVNLVMVPVVVRDRRGRAVDGLGQQDFQLFDKGKPQAITRFSVEKRPAGGALEVMATGTSPSQGENGAPAGMADRFVAYLFDDVHARFGDLARARDAAIRHMSDQLHTGDRVAVFTTSGQVMQEFTDEMEKIHAALARLQPRPIARSTTQECPDISYYMADLIVNRHDPMATQAAASEAAVCAGGGTREMAIQFASNRLAQGDHETRVSLAVLRDVVRRMASMPGERVLVLVSPGFLTLVEHQQEKTDLIERAIRGNVIVNAINLLGLAIPGFDASQRVISMSAQRVKDQYASIGAIADEDVLVELTAGTGGTFFHNNNDLDEGLRRAASAPDVYYLLGFSPQNLKLDGSFHTLRVTLKSAGDTSLQARKGYYAPRRLDSAEENVKREIEEALFSREELSDMPVELRTQFFKPTEQTANVAVLAHLDLRHIKFRKADGRNVDNLTVVAALFDRNGNFVTGLTKKIEFHLLDRTLQSRLEQGITVCSNFDVKPGTYMVRLVVRDGEGQQMAAENGSVFIP
ncbi:MAG: VWA domain-containing protein [Bryobacteraceae bacterium]